MKNWLGQEIEVGTIVGRGTKLSSSSVFQVGVVTELDPDRLKARVAWKYRSRGVVIATDSGKKWPDGRVIFDREYVGFAPSENQSASNGGKGALCTVESLFVLPEDTFDRADRLAALATELYSRHGKPGSMTKEEWLARVDAL